MAGLLAGLSCAQEHRSLLWAVNAPGDTCTSYLFGTLHSRDARAFRFADSVLIAFDHCDVLAGELEVDETKKMDPSVMNAMFLPDGRSLDRLYSKKDYKRVIAVLKDRLGPLAPLCTRVRPFYTIAMLSEMELGNDSAEVLDAWLQSRAQRMKKRVMGLETVAEQLEAVQRIPLRDQAKLLMQVVDKPANEAGSSEALTCYTTGDLDCLMGQLERDGLPEHADKALLASRNVRMADRLAKNMGGKHRVFAAVGAAHLPGKSGLIQLLRAKGFTVRPVISDGPEGSR